MKKIILAAALLAIAITSGCAGSSGDESFEKVYIPPETAETPAGSADSALNDSLTDGTSESVNDSREAPETSADTSSVPEQEPSAGAEQIYDTAPIAEAYLSGDAAGLDELQIAILDKAAAVIAECVTEDMNPYQKELAIHDWLIRYCTYDKGELRAIKTPGEHASDPYGALIDGQAICMGYTTTFKLFMDMLQIPCGIVHSTDKDGDEHAWNTVQLDGCWYYVDTTWDDPVPDNPERDIKHQYFNITRDEISIEHVLPDDAPQSESAQWLFATQELATITELSQISEAVIAAAAQGRSDAVLYFDMDVDIETGTMLSGSDRYYFVDKLLKDGVPEACRSAGFDYRYASMRITDKGPAVLINFVR